MANVFYSTFLNVFYPATQPPPPQAARGRQGGGHVPKAQGLKAAVGVRDRATGKTLEGADRQTDFPPIIVRLLGKQHPGWTT